MRKIAYELHPIHPVTRTIPVHPQTHSNTQSIHFYWYRVTFYLTSVNIRESVKSHRLPAGAISIQSYLIDHIDKAMILIDSKHSVILSSQCASIAYVSPLVIRALTDIQIPYLVHMRIFFLVFWWANTSKNHISMCENVGSWSMFISQSKEMAMLHSPLT